MPQVLRVRELTAAEEQEISRLVRARTAPVRLVERARIIDLAAQGWRAPGHRRRTRGVGPHRAAVGEAVNGPGAGRAGGCAAHRPPRDVPPAAVGELVAASLTDPQALGLPFGSWTLDRLAAYLHETKGIAMKRSRIGAILQAEGLRWRRQETWFGERPDPAFAEKRGPSSRSTPPLRRRVS